LFRVLRGGARGKVVRPHRELKTGSPRRAHRRQVSGKSKNHEATEAQSVIPASVARCLRGSSTASATGPDGPRDPSSLIAAVNQHRPRLNLPRDQLQELVVVLRLRETRDHRLGRFLDLLLDECTAEEMDTVEVLGIER